ncbi:hybrid sensor histidine kinase/response regulator [Rhizobium sp. AC44/96]|uniref:response regulator n=1 Tax=unclassified Rhizobium TaxID=2613769 RepID=UPI00080F9AE9|nr:MULTISPECIES: response regulator [unclassified Rhizobium]MDM9619037.1 response regulator [Rhizobium sp. S96]OCJ17639.1 hybrid sensor histidine kinase/response regulator [Rhizobium sp. AC44/96]
MSDESSILIIDDNIDDREVYRRMLSRATGARYTVFEADNGSDGLALNAAKRPSCILLDFSLPGRDGLGVLEDILATDPKANVIMLTGQGSETVAVEVMKRGARDYLTKDMLSSEALHRCVQSAIMHGELEAQLEQKRQSLEIFTRAMAHDLKEPLRTIKSFSKLLQGSKALGSEDHELLAYVLNAADHMEELIVKVSRFTKLEASGEFEAKPVALQTVLAQAESNLRELISSRQARIVRSPLPEVMGDATLLVQLMQNLILNAVHHCDAAVPEVRISAERDGGICRLVVEDNGPGIAPEHRDLIFQPFKRLVDRSVDGTGLGLAISKRIVQLHDGAIWCEDGEDGGARFVIELPLAPTAAIASDEKTAGAEATSPEPGTDGTARVAEVLLVDDSPADVQILKIKLMRREKVSFNLHVASNGRDAMRMLAERSTTGAPAIDLMLLDINMPIMDGFEVLRALSDDQQLNTIPVCILSTSSDEDDMRQAKALGALAYMVKPPTLAQLAMAIDGLSSLTLQPRGDALVLCAGQFRQESPTTA